MMTGVPGYPVAADSHAVVLRRDVYKLPLLADDTISCPISMRFPRLTFIAALKLIGFELPETRPPAAPRQPSFRIKGGGTGKKKKFVVGVKLRCRYVC